MISSIENVTASARLRVRRGSGLQTIGKKSAAEETHVFGAETGGYSNKIMDTFLNGSQKRSIRNKVVDATRECEGIEY